MLVHMAEENAGFDLKRMANSLYTIYVVCYAIGYYLYAALLSWNRTPYVYGTNNGKTTFSGQPGSLSAHLFSLGKAPEIQHGGRGRPGLPRALQRGVYVSQKSSWGREADFPPQPEASRRSSAPALTS